MMIDEDASNPIRRFSSKFVSSTQMGKTVENINIRPLLVIEVFFCCNRNGYHQSFTASGLRRGFGSW